MRCTASIVMFVVCSVVSPALLLGAKATFWPARARVFSPEFCHFWTASPAMITAQ